MLGVSIGAAVGMQSTDPPSGKLSEQFDPQFPQAKADSKIGPLFAEYYEGIFGGKLDLDQCKMAYEEDPHNTEKGDIYACGKFIHLEEQTQAFYDSYQGRCPQEAIEQFFSNVIAPAAEVFRQIEAQTTGDSGGKYSRNAQMLDDHASRFSEPQSQDWHYFAWELMIYARRNCNLVRYQRGLPMADVFRVDPPEL
jgi:hypothetical protein